jgi:segregation and condensation protein B
MEERMTQEPREVSADEPQVRLEETDEQIDATDEDRIADDQEMDELTGESETPDEPEEEMEIEDRDAGEAGDEDLEAAAEETDEPADADQDQATAEAAEVEFEEDQEKALDEDNDLEGDAAKEAVDGDEEPEDSVEQDESEEKGEEASEEPNQAEDTEEEAPTVESVIEAILFATDEPLTESRLANIVESTGKQVRQCIEALNEKYEKNHNAFRIEQIAGGHQMLTLSTYNTWLRRMLRARSDNKLSPAAMETLAIVAYKQPVIRVDVEGIRGVAVGEVIRNLMYKGLVKIVGRAEILGRPMLYGTTKKFLEVFGLNSLKDLPKAEELKKPD